MISLRLYDRDGTTALGLLPEPIGFQISVEFSDLGALQFEYPVNGINASELAVMREIAITNEAGTEFTNARYVISSINRDRLASTGTITVSARSLLWRFDTALAYPDGGIASGEVVRTFNADTAGTILKTLIDDAKVRGALSGISYTFTGINDSTSTAWADTTDAEYPARSSILAVMRQLAELGLVEVQMNARALSAARPDGIGSDLTVTANPIVLRDGLNLTEAPEEINADKLAAVALVEADEGQILERSNSTTLSTYGRLETSFTASGIDDPLVINELSDNYLSTVASPNRQLTVGLTMQEGAPQPLTDFTVGDYVFTATSAGLERVRVRQITISMSNGLLTATATLGDRIFENEIRQARKLAAITSGSVNIGNGSQPSSTPTVTVTADAVAPAAPSSLAGASTAYLEASNPRANVALSWTPPTLNSDSTTLLDLASFEVQRRTSSTGAWEFAGSAASNGLTVSGLAVGTSYRFQVVAIDVSGNRSAASNEFIITTSTNTSAPAVPSTPTLTSRLGTITLNWNGKTSAGAAMSSDFDFAVIHRSTTSGFTPSDSNAVAILPGAGIFVFADLTYNQTYYFKIVAYNTSDVASSASAEASASVTPLVDADLIGKVISGAKIVNGSITASDAIIGNTITGGLIQASAITADKIAANAITADKIEAGAITAAKIAAGTITATQISSSYVYSGTIAAGNITAGTITASVAFTAASGSFSGTITANSGTIGGFTLSSSSIYSGSNLSINSNGTIQGGNAATLYYGYINIGGGSAGSERLIVSGNSSFTGQAVFTNNVTSQTHFFSPYANNVTSAANGYWVSSSGRMTYTTASSQRFKHDIVDLRDVPELDPKILLNLPVRAFRYNEGYVTPSDDRAETLIPGFIAEEVDEVYSIACDYEEGPQSWNERMIVPGMLALIQDLTTELAELKATLNGEAA